MNHNVTQRIVNKAWAHREQLSLVAPIKIEGLRAEHGVYLEFHRSTLWRQ